jgi:hypothetical protein
MTNSINSPDNIIMSDFRRPENLDSANAIVGSDWFRSVATKLTQIEPHPHTAFAQTGKHTSVKEAHAYEEGRIIASYDIPFKRMTGVSLSELARVYSKCRQMYFSSRVQLVEDIVAGLGINEAVNSVLDTKFKTMDGKEEILRLSAIDTRKIAGYTARFTFIRLDRPNTPTKAGEPDTADQRYPIVFLSPKALDSIKKYGGETSFKKITAALSNAYSDSTHDYIHSAMQRFSWDWDSPQVPEALREWHFETQQGDVMLFRDPEKTLWFAGEEHMAAKLHFNVWQHIFNDVPGTKNVLVHAFAGYLAEVDKLEKTMSADVGAEEAAKLKRFLEYLYIDRLLYIIHPQDKALEEVFERFPHIREKVATHRSRFITVMHENAGITAGSLRGEENNQLPLSAFVRTWAEGLKKWRPELPITLEEFDAEGRRHKSVSMHLDEKGIGSKRGTLEGQYTADQLEFYGDEKQVDARTARIMGTAPIEEEKRLGKEAQK